jgi:anthranilate synthase component 1
LERELLADEKERAEHLMLVDLGRNDLGRVCKPGTVKVADFMRVERYSHVMHLVSDVEGEVMEGLSAFDVLKACFPAGTVSGAPKVRAMQIIEELEPERRGIYAGSVGYVSFDGNMDMAIAIRTAVCKGGRSLFKRGLA